VPAQVKGVNVTSVDNLTDCYLGYLFATYKAAKLWFYSKVGKIIDIY
jgi:hypothetical protein